MHLLGSEIDLLCGCYQRWSLAEEQKKVDEAKKFGAIDYDAPVPASPTALADNVFAKVGYIWCDVINVWQKVDIITGLVHVVVFSCLKLEKIIAFLL